MDGTDTMTFQEVFSKIERLALRQQSSEDDPSASVRRIPDFVLQAARTADDANTCVMHILRWKRFFINKKRQPSPDDMNLNKKRGQDNDKSKSGKDKKDKQDYTTDPSKKGRGR